MPEPSLIDLACPACGLIPLAAVHVCEWGVSAPATTEVQITTELDAETYNALRFG